MRIADRFFTILFLSIFFLAMWIVYSHATTGLVGIFERMYGSPGTRHVLTECSCTVRYVETRVNGADYYVHFKKLD